MSKLTSQEENRLKRLAKIIDKGNIGIATEINDVEKKVEELEIKVDTNHQELDLKVTEALTIALETQKMKGDDGYTPVKGTDYFDGKDYELKADDLDIIASIASQMIDVPIVEKVIEKIIIEKPLVTEVTNNIENKDTGELIINKINLDENSLIKREKIDGDLIDRKTLDEDIATLQNRTQLLLQIATQRSNSSAGITGTIAATQVAHGTAANTIGGSANFTHLTSNTLKLGYNRNTDNLPFYIKNWTDSLGSNSYGSFSIGTNNSINTLPQQIVVGNDNIVATDIGGTFGHLNTVKDEDSWVFGHNNFARGIRALVLGIGNVMSHVDTGYHTLIGQNNTTNTGNAVTTLGNDNANTAGGFTIGNNITNASGNFEFGLSNTTKATLNSGGNLTVLNLTDSALTINRVPFTSTGGLLVDSTSLTFDGTNFDVGGNNRLSIDGGAVFGGGIVSILSNGDMFLNQIYVDRIDIVNTSQQLFIGYDASNYLTVTVDSGGNVALDASGGTPGFSFNDPIVTSSSIQVNSIVNDTGLAHGTYTPTLFNTTNVGASTARLCTYMRVGNTVTVSGQLDIDPTATLTATLLGISLPVASALTTAYQLGGTASAIAIAGMSGGIEADATNDRASLKFIATDVSNRTMAFTFTYQVI